MNSRRAFIRFNILTLILIYLVVIAGSFVRISGSGMGCPDWPKCFGQWVPPSDETDLPENYKEIYSDIRSKKIEKFARFLKAIGLKETAEKLINDPALRIEQDFNGTKTRTEYVNRLVGFLAGNAMLLGFIWLIVKFRNRKLILVAGINLVLMATQAWFGSIVVASNLVPWTITVHMLLALIIIALQIYFIWELNDKKRSFMNIPVWMKLLVWTCLIVTFYQMFLGTQVREAIDELSRQGFKRNEWIDKLGISFFIHRSFSWMVLILLGVMFWYNERTTRYSIFRLSFIILVLELFSGIALAYADMPGLVQTAHLIFASVLFGILTIAVLKIKRVTKVAE